MDAVIRKGTYNDAEKLCELGRTSFYEKWVTTTSSANMNIYLKENFTIEKLHEELSDSLITYFVAEKDDRLLGYAKLLQADPDIETPEPGIVIKYQNPLEISRLYVSPQLTGQSIGAKIMDQIFLFAEEKRFDLIWLGVWENNTAIGFYKRHGFMKAGTHKFTLGDQVDNDWIMIKSIL
ncbi:MAG: GNAT family N-acetyltransferase [Chitinophagales bacterium]|nr:GNAT family N-acetyltransferase [Chitinophagales bacterium]